MTVFCRRCRKGIPDNSRFCPFCRAQQDVADVALIRSPDSGQLDIPVLNRNGGIPAQRFPLKAPSRSSISDTVTATNVEEEFWARALDECDGPSRRRGLWARVFSEAQGNEAIAKANYLKHRAAELRVDDQENRLRINEQEQRSAYDLLPKGRCPKCAAVIPLVSKECPECKEGFTAYEGWAAIPIAGSDADRSAKPEVNADTLAPTVGEKAAAAVIPSEAKGEIPRNLVTSSTATVIWSTGDWAFTAFLMLIVIVCIGFAFRILDTNTSIAGNSKSNNNAQNGTLPDCQGSYSRFIWTNCIGTFVYNDGQRYVGGFYENLYHGVGVLYRADGTVEKSGNWAKGEFVGNK